ncbi:ATP-grasp domain-containing protein [Stenotrophomonas maltophilia]
MTDTSSVSGMRSDLFRAGLGGAYAVTSLTDRSMKVAILLGLELRAITPDKSLLYLLEKSVVCHLVPEFCPESMFVSIGSFGNRHGCMVDMLRKFGSVIFKPSRGSAGLGNYVATSEEELIVAKAHLISCRESGVGGEGWIVQPYIEGDVFSVEGFVREGMVEILGYTFRRKVQQTLTAAYFPGDHFIESEAANSAARCVRELVVRSGYANGYFHSEFIAGHGGVHLIDANFGRVAGGAISILMAANYEKPLWRLVKHALSVGLSLNDLESITRRKGQQVFLGITYGVSADGVFESVELPDNLRSTHISLCNAGQQLRAIGADGSAWVGIMAGAEAEVMREVGRLRIRCEDGVAFCPIW